MDEVVFLHLLSAAFDSTRNSQTIHLWKCEYLSVDRELYDSLNIE